MENQIASVVNEILTDKQKKPYYLIGIIRVVNFVSNLQLFSKRRSNHFGFLWGNTPTPRLNLKRTNIFSFSMRKEEREGGGEWNQVHKDNWAGGVRGHF